MKDGLSTAPLSQFWRSHNAIDWHVTLNLVDKYQTKRVISKKTVDVRTFL